MYGPAGNLVASDDNRAGGVNADLTYNVLTPGTYVARVLSVADKGEYVLRITGATGAQPAPLVEATTPADGERLNAFPGTVRVDFSEGLLLTSIDTADLVIGGLPALGVTVIDGDTLEFTVDPAAYMGDGTYTVTVAAGAVRDLQVPATWRMPARSWWTPRRRSLPAPSGTARPCRRIGCCRKGR